MICEKCGKSNAPIKKCCASCGSFLVGMTINNVTGKYGYRGGDGMFYNSKEEYEAEKYKDELKIMSKTIEVKDCQYCPYLINVWFNRCNESSDISYRCSISNHTIKQNLLNKCNSIFRIPKCCPL